MELNKGWLFLHVAYNLPGIYDSETLDSYSVSDLTGLQDTLLERTRSLLELFRTSVDFGDCFYFADYPDLPENLDEGEERIFRAALDEGQHDLPMAELHSIDIFTGCCSLIEHRIRLGSVAALKDAVTLFNCLMESALFCDERLAAFCRILLLNPRELAEQLLFWTDQEERLKPLQPLMMIIKDEVHRPQWQKTIFRWEDS